MARKSKQRKWELNAQRKSTKARKTEASRDKRLANKKTRKAIHEVNRKAGKRDIGIIMVDQTPHERIVTKGDDGKETVTVGGKIELMNGIYRVVNEQRVSMTPSALPEGAIKTECDDDTYYPEITGISPYATAEDEHAAAEELAEYDSKPLPTLPPIFGEDGHVIDYTETCEHGNALASNCSDCDELAKHDAELGAKVGRQIDDSIEKQRLYAHKQLEERGKPICELPKLKKKGMFDVIKDKLRINNEG